MALHLSRGQELVGTKPVPCVQPICSLPTMGSASVRVWLCSRQVAPLLRSLSRWH